MVKLKQLLMKTNKHVVNYNKDKLRYLVSSKGFCQVVKDTENNPKKNTNKKEEKNESKKKMNLKQFIETKQNKLVVEKQKKSQLKLLII